eukprot:5324828-Prymnesium_polylepis.2
MMNHDESNASPAPTRTATSGARMSRSTFLLADAVPGGPPATFQSCDSGIWPPSLSSAAHALIRYEASNWNSFCKYFAASMYSDSERPCSGETRSAAPSTATLVLSRVKLSVLRAWSASDLQSSRSASATGRLRSVISGSAAASAASATFRDLPPRGGGKQKEAMSGRTRDQLHGRRREVCAPLQHAWASEAAGGAHLVLQLVNLFALCNDLSKVLYRPALGQLVGEVVGRLDLAAEGQDLPREQLQLGRAQSLGHPREVTARRARGRLGHKRQLARAAD